MAWIQETDKNGQPVCPFGKYIKKEGKTHGHYIIIRTRFEKYMSGEDMNQFDLQPLIEKISELEQVIGKLEPQS
jgi:SPX domain protein involved in polyphosphate accumulation